MVSPLRWTNGLASRPPIRVSAHQDEPVIFLILVGTLQNTITISSAHACTRNRVTYDHVVGEPDVKRHDSLDLPDMLAREGDVERANVGVEMLDFAPADDGEDEGCLLHHVRNRD